MAKLTPEQVEQMQEDLSWVQQVKDELEAYDRDRKRHPSYVARLNISDMGPLSNLRWKFDVIDPARKKRMGDYAVRLLREELKERIATLKQLGVDIE